MTWTGITKVHRSTRTKNKQVSTRNFKIKILQIRSFAYKNLKYSSLVKELFHSVTENRTQNLCLGGQPVVPLWYQCMALLDFKTEISLSIEGTDYRSNLAWQKQFFSKNVPVSRKYLSVSRGNLPGYFSVSFRFPQVTEFGKSTANRWRSTWPILFVNFTQSCDQHDRKIRTIRKSATRWRGRRAQGYRKLILRANLLYVPNIKM